MNSHIKKHGTLFATYLTAMDKILSTSKIIKFCLGLTFLLLVSFHLHAEFAKIQPNTPACSEKAPLQEQRETKDYTVTKATSEIKVDGSLDENAWKDAVVIKLPYEWLPGDNIPALVDTDCLVTYDDHFFYVAVRCYDPEPSKIRAHLMDRDSVDTFIQDDHICLMIDTFNDERRCFQFRSNPLGVQADAILTEGYEDFSWDTIWASAGKITDWGWAAEIAISFNQLRFPKTSEVQTWGFSIERSYPRNVRHRMRSHPIERDRTCIICQFNKITGMKGISPGVNIELDPTLTTIRTDRREDFPADPDSPMKNGDIDPEPGLTARWGITPNLMLNATVNPDFSQIEADVRELEVNTRFAIQYPEKRPFFWKGLISS